jgi:hypothetical protein
LELFGSLTLSASGEFELHVKDVNILFADELYGIIKFNIADLVDVCETEAFLFLFCSGFLF